MGHLVLFPHVAEVSPLDRVVPAGRKKPVPPPAPPEMAAARPKSKEDLFKQKLRAAVYDALGEKGVDQKSALFRAVNKEATMSDLYLKSCLFFSHSYAAIHALNLLPTWPF